MERYGSRAYDAPEAETEVEDDMEERWEAFLEDGVEAVLDTIAEGDAYQAGDPDWEPAIAYDAGYGQDDDTTGYRDIAVVEMWLPMGLGGFTDPDSDHVVVNERWYEWEKERTRQHEITHHLYPGKDEQTIRNINGDIDVRNTASYAAGSAGRIGNGNVEVPRYGS